MAITPSTPDEAELPGILKLPTEVRVLIYQYAGLNTDNLIDKIWNTGRRADSSGGDLNWSVQLAYMSHGRNKRFPTIAVKAFKSLSITCRRIRKEVIDELGGLERHVFRVDGRCPVMDSAVHEIAASDLLHVRWFAFHVYLRDRFSSPPTMLEKVSCCAAQLARGFYRSPAILQVRTFGNGECQCKWLLPPTSGQSRPAGWTNDELVRIEEAMPETTRCILQEASLDRHNLERLLDALTNLGRFDPRSEDGGAVELTYRVR